MPTLRRIGVYVSSRMGQRQHMSGTDTVVGPRSGAAIYTSGGIQMEWDTMWGAI
jgi:hypothetical protein